jgi:hypothetical protein
MGFAAFQVVAVGVMHGVMTAFMGDDPAATGNGAVGQANSSALLGCGLQRVA